MERKQIYLIVLMVLAGLISVESLVQIARVAYFNETIYDLKTQTTSEAWISSHPLLFISLKITLFLATIQMSLFVITTYASYKELAACRCLIYFLPLFGLAGLVSTSMFLGCESTYTKALMQQAVVDPSTCLTFECTISSPYQRVWADTLIYLIFYICTLAAYWTIFFLRVRLFQKQDDARSKKESDKDDKHIIANDLEIDNVSQIYV